MGLRYYANVGITHATLKSNAVAQGYNWKDRVEGTLINYGANVDFLANFVANETMDFGGFIGLGVGGNSWSGQDLDEHEDYLNSLAQNITAPVSLAKTGFDLSLNVGLRANIAKNHGVELVAKVPFLKTTLLDRSISVKINGNGGGNVKVRNTLHSPFSVTARYVFSF
ncbi:outer membrane beta-barrel protein [Helicobacter sp. 23-1044]